MKNQKNRNSDTKYGNTAKGTDTNRQRVHDDRVALPDVISNLFFNSSRSIFGPVAKYTVL